MEKHGIILKWAQNLEDCPSRTVEHIPQFIDNGPVKGIIDELLRFVLPLAMLDRCRLCTGGSRSTHT